MDKLNCSIEAEYVDLEHSSFVLEKKKMILEFVHGMGYSMVYGMVYNMVYCMVYCMICSMVYGIRYAEWYSEV